MKVMKTTYPGWNQYPVYYCSKTPDWHEVSSWSHQNGCEPMLLSSGIAGYVFQIRKNIEWFILKWQ